MGVLAQVGQCLHTIPHSRNPIPFVLKDFREHNPNGDFIFNNENCHRNHPGYLVVIISGRVAAATYRKNCATKRQGIIVTHSLFKKNSLDR
jgi:hypothetical protein